MADGLTRIYLDACLYLDWFQGDGEYLDELAQIFDTFKTGRLTIVASPLLLAEASGKSVPPESQERIDRFFQSEGIIWIDTGRVEGGMARDLVRSHGVRGADAVHIISSYLGDAEILFTRDSKMLRAEEYEGVPIAVPKWQGQLSLHQHAAG